MVNIRCSSEEYLKLVEMEPFQGKLKKRTGADIGSLAESIKEEGLLMPFAVWVHDGKNLLLDGHGRREALLSLGDPDIEGQDFPVVYIDAESEDEARKALLQITSQYGKISKWGLKEFTKTIPEYRAPVISSFVKKQAVKRPRGSVNKVGDEGEAEIRIMVKREKLNAVLRLFEQVEYIRVCGYVQ